MTEVFHYHPPPLYGLDDDEERELVACSVARNGAFQLIDDAVRRAEECAERSGTEMFGYPFWWSRIFNTMELCGYSRRTGVRKRPDINPAFHCHISGRTGEIVWNGKTYPSPEHWRPTRALRRRRGAPKPRRKK